MRADKSPQLQLYVQSSLDGLNRMARKACEDARSDGLRLKEVEKCDLFGAEMKARADQESIGAVAQTIVMADFVAGMWDERGVTMKASSARLTPCWFETKGRGGVYVTLFSDGQTLFSQLLWQPVHRGQDGWLRELEAALREAVGHGVSVEVQTTVEELQDVPRDAMDDCALYPNASGGWGRIGMPSEAEH